MMDFSAKISAMLVWFYLGVWSTVKERYNVRKYENLEIGYYC